jgi:hypothetical protein
MTGRPRVLRVAALMGSFLAGTGLSSFGQQTTVSRTGGGGFAMAAFQDCAWSMDKPFEMWGYMKVTLSGDRQFAEREWEGNDPWMNVALHIDATYLPSTTLFCSVPNALIQYGSIIYPEGNTYSINHSNPSCDGHSPLSWGSQPTSTWWVSEELWNTRPAIADAVASGSSYYWAAVGSELYYTALQTPAGGDVGFYPSFDLPPTVRADFNPSTRTIRINVVNYNHYNSGQWQAISSHELGHAVGFDHASTADWSKTIMVNFYYDQEGLAPRSLDKCAAVKAFPVDLER